MQLPPPLHHLLSEDSNALTELHNRENQHQKRRQWRRQLQMLYGHIPVQYLLQEDQGHKTVHCDIIFSVEVYLQKSDLWAYVPALQPSPRLKTISYFFAISISLSN